MAALISTLVTLTIGITSFASSPELGKGTHLARGVVWFDLMVSDLSHTQKFYGSLFGWKFRQLTSNYYTVESGGVPIGGVDLMPGGTKGDGIAIYFEVTEVKATLEQAKIQGAQVILEPKNLPSGAGSMALFRDLEGNPVGLFSKNHV